MCLTPRYALALTVPILIAEPASVFAQAAPIAGTTVPSSGATLTGKERLGKKWTDEQRIDNCKVPLDKRGPKPRPDICQNVPAR